MSTATVFSDWDKREEFRQLKKGVGLLTSFLRDGRMDQSMQRGYLQFSIRAGERDIIHGALSHLLLAPLAHSPDIPSPLATSLLPAPWAYHALGLKAEEKENFCCNPETYKSFLWRRTSSLFAGDYPIVVAEPSGPVFCVRAYLL